MAESLVHHAGTKYSLNAPGKQSMKCRVCMLPNRLSISTSSKHSTAYIFFIGKQVAAVEVGGVVLAEDAKDRSKEKRQEQSQKHPTYYQFSFLSKILLEH